MSNSKVETDKNMEQKNMQNILNDALIYFEKPDLQGAIDYLEKAEELVDDEFKENNPADDVAAFYNMKGFIYLGMKEWDNARFNFEQALEINAASSQACLGLGEIFLMKEQYTAAKTMFEWGVKNNPKNDIAVEALNKVEMLLENLETSHI